MIEKYTSELLGMANRIAEIAKEVGKDGDPESRGHTLENAAVEIREAVNDC
jgi:hypothetical protein